MDFAGIQNDFNWIAYSGQSDCDVTYLFVLDRPVARLVGVSDILYIGKTEQAVRTRCHQETRPSNSASSTQQTNIRV